MFDPREKIALFIDGANLYAASKSLGFDIDYRKLLKAFQKRGYLLRAYYYTALIEDQEYSSIRPLIDWLDYNGYKVVTKPAKEFTDSLGRRKIKGNMDIELAIDAMEQSESVDHLVIFSGDGDFTTLVEALQRKGRKVSVVSTMSTQPPMITIGGDFRRTAASRQAHLGMVIGANDGRIEIGETIDLRAAEEARGYPASLEPVAEHFRHRDGEERGIA